MRHRLVNVNSSKYEIVVFNCEQEKIHYSSEDAVEKSVSRDESLSSLSKPRDAKQRSSGLNVLSHPHTNGSFL